MMKNLFRKLGGREEEPAELDTGYDSGYYGGQPKDNVTEAPEAPKGYDEPEYRSDREYAPSNSADAGYRQPKREDGYYEEDTYAPRAERTYTGARYGAAPAPVNKGTLYFRPEFYSDKREEMVEGLADSHVVMISLNRMESADRMRLVDYLMGAVCALKGEVAYRNGIFALTPKGVELDEADYELLEDEDSFEDEVAEWDEDADLYADEEIEETEAEAAEEVYEYAQYDTEEN